MIKEAYQLNIDLPRCPKGTIVYREYDILPSQYGIGRTYIGNEKWYIEEGQYIGKVQVWDWIKGLIETCVAMANTDEIAKKLVTRIKV